MRLWNTLRETLSLIRGKKSTLLGLVIIIAFVVTSMVVLLSQILGMRVTPYDPIQQQVGPVLAGPSPQHIFGTDDLGRDVFSRVVAAIPNYLIVSVTVVAFAVFVGEFLGCYAAFRAGIVDEALMRVTDIFFAIPSLVLAMAIGIALGPGLTNMTLALMIVWWPAYARLARGEALKVSHENYVKAARISGLGNAGILVKHLIPNTIITMLVYATLDIGTVIVIYSGLSFLGLAVKPPAPDLGAMISEYQDYLVAAPWLPILPGIVIALGVVAFSLFGDGLRDVIEAF